MVVAVFADGERDKRGLLGLGLAGVPVAAPAVVSPYAAHAVVSRPLLTSAVYGSPFLHAPGLALLR